MQDYLSSFQQVSEPFHSTSQFVWVSVGSLIAGASLSLTVSTWAGDHSENVAAARVDEARRDLKEA